MGGPRIEVSARESQKSQYILINLEVACVCVEMNAENPSPGSLVVSLNGESSISIKFEYKRTPPLCNHCKVFGHSDKNCPVAPLPK